MNATEITTLTFLLAGLGILMGRQKSRRATSPGHADEKEVIPVCYPALSRQLASRWQRYLHPKRPGMASKVGLKPLLGQHRFSGAGRRWPRFEVGWIPQVCWKTNSLHVRRKRAQFRCRFWAQSSPKTTSQFKFVSIGSFPLWLD